MTTNKPEVFRFHCHGQSAPAYSCNKPADNSGEYVRLSDHEALQAEYEKLRKDAERYRWLRRHATLDGGSNYLFPEVHAWEYKEGAEPNEQYGSLDCAIDAAIQEQTK